ncbi:MAG: glucosaminidase domain-containing protein, partial [Bacteroidales bacterium]
MKRRMKGRAGRSWKIRTIWILALGTAAPAGALAQRSKDMTREYYIETYAELAMKEMQRTGIPASITLAQGCLESDNGNSRLAVKANNHFGIKCHDWEGESIRHDDDARNECFRSYPTAYDSYVDHSLFLSTKPRYASLFELKPDDYKGWARGLKKAGYATAPDYAGLLIKIIEENELDRYDGLVLAGGHPHWPKPGEGPGANAYLAGREVRVNNGIEYILAQPGDTPEGLRKELGLYKNEIVRYNEMSRGERLEAGQIVYL